MKLQAHILSNTISVAAAIGGSRVQLLLRAGTASVPGNARDLLLLGEKESCRATAGLTGGKNPQIQEQLM